MTHDQIREVVRRARIHGRDERRTYIVEHLTGDQYADYATARIGWFALIGVGGSAVLAGGFVWVFRG